MKLLLVGLLPLFGTLLAGPVMARDASRRS
jgi:hypothetical protein